MIKCIFIDSNKTLEDDDEFLALERTYYHEIAEVLQCNVDVLYEHLKFYNDRFGKHVWEYHEIYWRSLVNRIGGNNNQDLIDNIYSIFLDFYEKHITLYPDVMPALNQLKALNVKLILVANGNSKRVQRLIRKFNFNEYFTDFVISSETPYRKPDAFMFNFGREFYNIDAKDILMVGDRIINDISGAKKCNMNTAIIRRSQEVNIQTDEIADFSISSLIELSNIYNCSLNLKNNKAVLSKYILKKSVEDNNMTALIVAGGRGSRLGTISNHTQKCMLKIWDDDPIIKYVIDILISVGCRKIIIAVNYLSEQIENYVSKYEDIITIECVKGEYSSTYDALVSSIDKLSDKFFYIHGDILFEPRLLLEMKQYSDKFDDSCIAVINNQDIHLTHAQVSINSENIITDIDLSEKDEHFPYTFLGAAIYKKSNFDINDKGGMVEKNIKMGIENDVKTRAVIYDGGWRHFETEKDYLKAKNENAWNIFND